MTIFSPAVHPWLLSLVGWLLLAAAALAADPGPARPAEAIRNVVLIVSDDLRANVLGCYGNRDCQTPHLDALARGGLVFDRAYCQGTWCAPSRQSFMFSRYQGTGSVNLGQHFRRHGHYVARVGKIYHMRVPGDIIAGTNGQDVASSWTERFNSPGPEAHSPGAYACLNLNIFTDSLQDRQSTRMPHRMFVSVRIDGDGSEQPDHKSASKAIELMASHRQTPFFLAIGLVRPHYPMVAPEDDFRRYRWQDISLPVQQRDDLADIPKLGWASTRSQDNSIGDYPDNQQRMWAAYYASVTFMDRQVGRVMKALEEQGLSDQTAVVFTSDHGYHLGDHGFWQKSNLHEEVIRVPLVIAAPGFATGRSDSPVELVDLFPTLAELAGLPPAEGLDGTSLVPILRDPRRRVRSDALSLDRSGYSLRTDHWHYIRYRDGSAELYDMRDDPGELTNLAGQPAHSQRIRQLDAALESRVEGVGTE